MNKRGHGVSFSIFFSLRLKVASTKHTHPPITLLSLTLIQNATCTIFTRLTTALRLHKQKSLIMS